MMRMNQQMQASCQMQLAFDSESQQPFINLQRSAEDENEDEDKDEEYDDTILGD